MDVKTSVDGTRATIEVAGKLTVNTARELKDEFDHLPDGVCDLRVDLTDVDYVSSAGLRTFVQADKFSVNRGGAFYLLHPNDDVMGVLEMTGLSGVLHIER